MHNTMQELRVQIKFTTIYKQSSTEVLASLAEACPKVMVSDINIIRGAAMITLENRNCLTQLLTDNVRDQLLTKNLRPITPPWMTAEKTIFIARVRELYTECDPAVLLRDINHLNPFKTTNIEIIPPKGNYRPTMKLTMASKEDADRALSSGIKLNHSIIHAEHLQREIIMDLRQCYRCFRFSHHTSQCNCGELLCSICGDNHHYSVCPTPKSP